MITSEKLKTDFVHVFPITHGWESSIMCYISPIYMGIIKKKTL